MLGEVLIMAHSCIFYDVSIISSTERWIYCPFHHTRELLKVKIPLFVVGIKSFPANQYGIFECLHCAFPAIYIFTGSVYQR